MAERIYIAGPMTGLPAFNRPAFAAAAAHLRSLGLEAINPGELHPHTHLPWSFYMRSALAAMLTCDSILLLNGWTNSRGAKMEFQIADALGMHIYHEGTDFEWGTEGAETRTTAPNPAPNTPAPVMTENAGETWHHLGCHQQ